MIFKIKNPSGTADGKDYILVYHFEYIVFFYFRKANICLCYNTRTDFEVHGISLSVPAYNQKCRYVSDRGHTSLPVWRILRNAPFLLKYNLDLIKRNNAQK